MTDPLDEAMHRDDIRNLLVSIRTGVWFIAGLLLGIGILLGALVWL